MSDVMILDFPGIKGNCQIEGYQDKILITSYSHGARMPMQGDVGNSERTAGRPILTDMSLTKMSDLSTPDLYKHCTQGLKAATAKLMVGRVEDGKFMNLLTYELGNAVISDINTSGQGGIPTDSLLIAFSKIKSEYTQQNVDGTKKGTSAWNWNSAEMRSE